MKSPPRNSSLPKEIAGFWSRKLNYPLFRNRETTILPIHEHTLLISNLELIGGILEGKDEQ
jgi:hypothetical protein